MKTYTMSFAASVEHKPEHPDRTAKRQGSGAMSFDVTFQVWPSRAAMAKSIRMQECREHKLSDWKACVPLTPSEGYGPTIKEGAI